MTKGATPGYWLLVAATLGLLGAMVGWSLPIVQAEAGGLAPFDLRANGYGLEEAQAFLAALSPAGLAQYGGPQAIMDSIFPPLMFASLGIALWHLSESFRSITRYALVAVAAVGMGADGFENAMIRDMLVAGSSGLTADMVLSASRLTVTKFAAYAASFIALGILVLRHILMRRRAAGKGSQ